MDKKKFSVYIAYFLVGVALITIYKTFDNLGFLLKAAGGFFSLLSPFIIGFVIAYILYPTSIWLEKYLEKIKRLRRFRRGLAISLTYIFYLAIIYFVIANIVPVLKDTMFVFYKKLPDYYSSIVEYFKVQSQGEGIIALICQSSYEYLQNNYMNIYNNLDFYAYFTNLWGVTTKFFSFLMGVIISVYILFERSSLKEMFYRLIRLILKPKTAEVFYVYVRKINDIFFGFFYGKLIDSLIIGIMAAIGFKLLGVPYDLLMAFIVGLLNIIPYFGPFIGAVPPVLVTFFDSPVKAIWTALFILVLQQFDGIVLGPKILGDWVGVSAFWILFAIIIGGGLFGIWGMLLGVPVIAALRIISGDLFTYIENKRIDKSKSAQNEG